MHWSHQAFKQPLLLALTIGILKNAYTEFRIQGNTNCIHGVNAHHLCLTWCRCTHELNKKIRVYFPMALRKSTTLQHELSVFWHKASLCVPTSRVNYSISHTANSHKIQSNICQVLDVQRSNSGQTLALRIIIQQCNGRIEIKSSQKDQGIQQLMRFAP